MGTETYKTNEEPKAIATRDITVPYSNKTVKKGSKMYIIAEFENIDNRDSILSNNAIVRIRGDEITKLMMPIEIVPRESIQIQKDNS